MRHFLLGIILLIIATFALVSQTFPEIKKYEPQEEYDNIYVKKLADDSLQTTFLIFIKKEVPIHYHAEHTENIYVLEGKASMLLNKDTIEIQEGTYLNIPAGTPHGVWVTSKKPLKVISIQSPSFDGSDRILLK